MNKRYIYYVSLDNNTVKLGRTDDPNRRLKSYTTTNPGANMVIFEVKDDVSAETELLRQARLKYPYFKHRSSKNSEVFEMTPHQANHLCVSISGSNPFNYESRKKCLDCSRIVNITTLDKNDGKRCGRCYNKFSVKKDTYNNINSIPFYHKTRTMMGDEDISEDDSSNEEDDKFIDNRTTEEIENDKDSSSDEDDISDLDDESDNELDSGSDNELDDELDDELDADITTFVIDQIINDRDYFDIKNPTHLKKAYLVRWSPCFESGELKDHYSNDISNISDGKIYWKDSWVKEENIKDKDFLIKYKEAKIKRESRLMDRLKDEQDKEAQLKEKQFQEKRAKLDIIRKEYKEKKAEQLKLVILKEKQFQEKRAKLDIIRREYSEEQKRILIEKNNEKIKQEQLKLEQLRSEKTKQEQLKLEQLRSEKIKHEQLKLEQLRDEKTKQERSDNISKYMNQRKVEVDSKVDNRKRYNISNRGQYRNRFLHPKNKAENIILNKKDSMSYIMKNNKRSTGSKKLMSSNSLFRELCIKFRELLRAFI